MCSIFLIKPQRYKTVVFAAKYQLKRVTVAILNCTSFQFMLPYHHRLLRHWQQTIKYRKRKSFKQYFYQNNKMFCGINSYNTCSNSVFRH